MNKNTGKIILASASPRRRELLAQIGIAFDVMVSDKEERITAEEPAEICMHLAMQKALDVREKLKAEVLDGEAGAETETATGPAFCDYTIVGADTIVVLEREILGKPHDAEDAARMLRALSGREHQVYTGVCVVRGDCVRTFAEKTDVYVAPLSEEDIRSYVATGDPMDKAGAYGIQGIFAKHIEKIDGDYYNVVGLPVGRLWREYLKRGNRFYEQKKCMGTLHQGTDKISL